MYRIFSVSASIRSVGDSLTRDSFSFFRATASPLHNMSSLKVERTVQVQYEYRVHCTVDRVPGCTGTYSSRSRALYLSERNCTRQKTTHSISRLTSQQSSPITATNCSIICLTMTRLNKSRGARLNAQRAFQFWRSWFLITVVGLIVLLSLSRNRDLPGADLLLDTTVASENQDNERYKSNSGTGNRHLSLRPTRGNGEEGPGEEVYFLNRTQLSKHDGFSATWLTTKEDFLTLPFDLMHSCEMTSFRAFDMSREEKMRMTLDWTQFSVEHMSKWWKIVEWDRDPIPHNKIIAQFQKYLKNGPLKFPMKEPKERVFQDTIAVLAFQSYRSEGKPEAAHTLTALSLAATIESLRRAGFGRCVVSVLVPGDIPMVTDAFRYLSEQLGPKTEPGVEITKVGHLEVGYAFANRVYIKTVLMPKNMPRGTVMTLRDAMLYSSQSEDTRTEDMKQNITAWLGDTRQDWNYVYLSEPDTILQTRPRALPKIKAEIDKGNVMLPHRWQPIPHESDVKGMSHERGKFLLEDEFPEVVELDPIDSHDACCDEAKGPYFKPGMPPYQPLCGPRKFWYACGFEKMNLDLPDKHTRLKDYKLMRILGGMELTTIAGNEHARRCIIKKNSVCRPDDFYPEYTGLTYAERRKAAQELEEAEKSEKEQAL